MCVSVALCVHLTHGRLSREAPGWVRAFAPKRDGIRDPAGPRRAWGGARRIPGLGSHRECEVGAEKTKNSCASIGLQGRDELRGSQGLGALS